MHVCSIDENVFSGRNGIGKKSHVEGIFFVFIDIGVNIGALIADGEPKYNI